MMNPIDSEKLILDYTTWYDQNEKEINKDLVNRSRTPDNVEEFEKRYNEYLIKATKEHIQRIGQYPLHPQHICYERGHNMYSVGSFTRSGTYTFITMGNNRCSKCGYTEEYKYEKYNS